MTRKSPLIGPLCSVRYGSGLVKFVTSTTCLGVTINNKLSWSAHIEKVNKNFSNKVCALKRMCHLPQHVLQDIYFKTIIPRVTSAIAVWGNCSTSQLESLNFTHKRACRLMTNDNTSLKDSKWLPIDYFYKRRLLMLMFKVFYGLLDLFTKKVCTRVSRIRNQMNIKRIKTDFGRLSAQYRGPHIWNYLNSKVKICEVSTDAFKNILRKSVVDINNFTFNKEAILNKNKDNYFIYY